MRTRPLSLKSFNAVVKKVLDGGAVLLDVECGFGFWARAVKVSLYGIRAQNSNSKKGGEARTYLTRKLPIGKSIVLEVENGKPGKCKSVFGTLYGDVTRISCGLREEINANMVIHGYAEPVGKRYFRLKPEPDKCYCYNCLGNS